LAITRALDIQSYLSAPVVLSNGEVFGTVCCIGHHVRHDLRKQDARGRGAEVCLRAGVKTNRICAAGPRLRNSGDKRFTLYAATGIV